MKHRPAPPARVSTLELFFDLVFVFTITQVAHLVAHANGALDLTKAFLILTIAWWMYGGYAWLTSNLGTTANSIRILLLAGMAAYLVMAISIPRADGADGLAFALSFLVVTIIHAVLFTHAPNTSALAILKIAPYNLIGALFVVGAALVGPRWSWFGWLAAVLTFVFASVGRRERGFHVSASHFAERHGLVIIVAIGESVVSIGVGAADIPVRLPLIVAAVLGFAFAAAIWWCYFDRDDARGERALAHADVQRRASLAMYAYSYAHLVMLAGIVVVAAGMQGVIAGVVKPVTDAACWALAVGLALYLAGGALFRRLLDVGAMRVRLITAALALGTVPLGLAVGAVPQLALLVILIVAMLAVEQRAGRGVRLDDSQHVTAG